MLIYPFSTWNKVEEVLAKIDIDDHVISKFTNKAESFNLIIKDVKTSWANIIKQEILSVGGDAAISRHSYNCSKDKTDILLLGNKNTIIKLVNKLKLQPPCFKEISYKIEKILFLKNKNFIIADKTYNLSEDFLIMGILNVTPDSFSDGGLYNSKNKALKQVESLIEAGADIIDIGGESSNPNAIKISEAKEAERVLPIIEAIKNNFNIPMSIDSYKISTIKEAIKLGVSVVNDISSGSVIKALNKDVLNYNVSYIVMNNNSENLFGRTSKVDMENSSENFISFCNNFVLETEKIISLKDRLCFDPGIGFGISLNDTTKILKNIDAITSSLEYPILMGLSRKSYFKKLLNTESTDELSNTVSFLLMKMGLRFFRTHDPKGLSLSKKLFLEFDKV